MEQSLKAFKDLFLTIEEAKKHEITIDEMEITQNRNANEIETLFSILQESIRHNISLKVMDTDEDNPIETSIILESCEGCGISSLEKPQVIKVYQDYEAIVWVEFYGSEEATPFDDLSIENQIEIIKELENEN